MKWFRCDATFSSSRQSTIEGTLVFRIDQIAYVVACSNKDPGLLVHMIDGRLCRLEGDDARRLNQVLASLDVGLLPAA